MTPTAFQHDITRLAMTLAALAAVALADRLIWQRTVGRLPDQQPGDVGALARALATIGCVGGLGLVIGSAAACGLLVWLLRGLAPLP